MFAHLHVHTEYSVLDGASKIPALIKKAEENKQPALAITDHGNMFGVKDFLNCFAKMKSSVKPIVGCEVYVARGSRKERKGREDQSSFHLILLAKNLTGYHNLIKMVSLGYIEGMHYKPRIDRELLTQYHEGLICSSACLGGELPQAIMKGDLEEAERVILWYKELFGEDYYLEVQRHETDVPGADTNTFIKQQEVNEVLFELGEKLGVKVIATNDVHFVNEEDGPSHDRLICINTNSDYEDPTRLRYTQQEYLKSTEQMMEIFSDHSEVISNTLEIVEKVELYSLDSKPMMPHFPIPDQFPDADEYLRHLTYKGAAKKYPELTDEIKERIDFELGVVKNMGFPDYFLIVQDFISYARSVDVAVGPGRGSAAGSVVAYCLGITNMDPIKYQLLFERFLNPDRISMPDIDIDFDDEGRYKVLQYVEEKYGKDHVSHVVTFGTMASKSAVKDVARIQKLPLQEADRLSKLIPLTFEVEETIEEVDKKDPNIKTITKVKKDTPANIQLCIERIPEFKEGVKSDNQILRDTIKYADKLEGTVRNIGVHACAIIIGPDNLTNLIPISTAKDKDSGEEILVSQFEGTLIESVGLLKMDFLGLRTLSIIKETISNIKKSKGVEIDIDNIPMDDKETLELFSRGDTIGVFQFESDGMQKSLRDLKPSSLEDLIAMNALYRPGPMEYIDDFVARKNGKGKIEYDLPEMEEILKETYGVTVYQEQVMLLSQKIAGFSKGKADVLRKAMGKKQISVMAELKEEFFAGGIKNGHPEAILNKIWNDWQAFAQYAFNKSHSTCYAWIGYQTGYLKAHYPAEFLAACLSKNLNDIEEITKFMDDCKRKGILVLGPNVNESFTTFTVNKEGNIRFGMGGIKGIGAKAVDSIIAERDENGAFVDIFNFVERVNISAINKKSLEALVFSGAFDCFEGVNRGTFLVESGKEETFMDSLLRYGNNFQKDADSSHISLFGGINAIETVKPEIPLTPELDQLELLKREKELVGMYISSHPLDKYRMEIELFSTASITDLDKLADEALSREKEGNGGKGSLMGKEFIIAGIVTSVKVKQAQKSNRPWCSIVLEDFYGNYTFSLFGKDYETYLGYTKEHLPLLIKVALTPRYPYISAEEKEKDRVPREKQIPNGCDIRIKGITLLSNVKESLIKGVTIHVPLSKLTTAFRKQLVSIIKENRGSSTLYLQIIDNENKIYSDFFSRKYKISPNVELLDFLNLNKITYTFEKSSF